MTELAGDLFKVDNMWGPEDLKRLIVREDAFLEGQKIYMGASNHCVIKGFHTYIDCDDIELRKILAYIESVDMGTWYILQTSPWNWSILNFTRVSWKKYMRILNECGLTHPAYIYCTGLKGYGVLRQGAKNGLVPRLRYTIGEGLDGCAICRDDFLYDMEEFG